MPGALGGAALAKTDIQRTLGVERFFIDNRKGKDSKFEDESRQMLAELLRGLSASEIDSRAEL